MLVPYYVERRDHWILFRILGLNAREGPVRVEVFDSSFPQPEGMAAMLDVAQLHEDTQISNDHPEYYAGFGQIK